MTALIYQGNGAFRPELPARDIDAEELECLATAQNKSVAQLVEGARQLYRVVEAPEVEAVEPKSLDEMSKDELRAACKDIGVSQAGSKDEMIARIRAKLDEAPEINAEDVPE